MLIETPIRLQETGNAQEPGAALFVFQQTLLIQAIPHGSLATQGRHLINSTKYKGGGKRLNKVSSEDSTWILENGLWVTEEYGEPTSYGHIPDEAWTPKWTK